MPFDFLYYAKECILHLWQLLFRSGMLYQCQTHDVPESLQSLGKIWSLHNSNEVYHGIWKL